MSESNRTVMFEGKSFKVIHEPMELKNGRVIQAEYVWRQDGVRVIARNADGAVLLTDESRAELGRRDYRLPGGKVEGEETPVEAARKELQEETGFVASEWQFLATSQAFATVRYRLHFFAAAGLDFRPVPHDEGEDIRVVWVEPERALEMALSGEIGEDLSALQLIRHLRGDTWGRHREADLHGLQRDDADGPKDSGRHDAVLHGGVRQQREPVRLAPRRILCRSSGVRFGPGSGRDLQSRGNGHHPGAVAGARPRSSMSWPGSPGRDPRCRTRW